nr:MAG TPA: hypothetical protein [Caudoviricetes sp.]
MLFFEAVSLRSEAAFFLKFILVPFCDQAYILVGFL